MITVSVEPAAEQLLALPAEAEAEPTEIGWGWSFDDGTFNTWIADPAALYAAPDSDGLISLVLTAPTDQGQVFYRSRVTVGDDGVMQPFADDVAADRGTPTTGSPACRRWRSRRMVGPPSTWSPAGSSRTRTCPLSRWSPAVSARPAHLRDRDPRGGD